MSGKIKYTDGPIDEVRIVEDFLPPPEELVFKEETVKVTMALNSYTVNFFKAEAKKAGVPYQRMIRKLLDDYVAKIELGRHNTGGKG